MDHTPRSIRLAGRVSCALGLALGILAGSVPTVIASDTVYTITMTLRGRVAPDVGFGLAVGGIFYAPFCVSEAEQESSVEENPGAPVDPICRSDRTYALKVSVGAGNAVPYEITIYRPRTARVLWSGSLTGDGRDHRLRYTYLFDLPATDAIVARATEVGRDAIGLPGLMPALVVTGGLASLLVSSLAHRRGRASAARSERGG